MLSKFIIYIISKEPKTQKTAVTFDKVYLLKSLKSEVGF
jgi:hypothetical protein